MLRIMRNDDWLALHPAARWKGLPVGPTARSYFGQRFAAPLNHYTEPTTSLDFHGAVYRKGSRIKAWEKGYTRGISGPIHRAFGLSRGFGHGNLVEQNSSPDYNAAN